MLLNIFDIQQLPSAEELVTNIYKNESIRIERIVSSGQITGWYDQPETEFVVLLDGEAGIEYENGSRLTLTKGDTLLIKPHEKHRVYYTSENPPCIWLCVFWP